MATVSGCPGTVDPGASDALPSDAGILQGGDFHSSLCSGRVLQSRPEPRAIIPHFLGLKKLISRIAIFCTQNE